MQQQHSTQTPLRYQQLLLDRMVTTDVSREYSLPDYQPEIKRLLRVTATVQPPTRYIGGGSIEFSGSVELSILYAGEDGSLYCFPATADYTLRSTTDDRLLPSLPDDALTCYALTDADGISCRVSGPRHLSVRCRVRGHIRAYGTLAPEEVWIGELSGTPQRLTHEIEVSRVLCGMSEPLSLQDEIIPDTPESTDTLRIVTADASVLIEECSVGADHVSCRGQLVLQLLLQNDGEPSAAGTPRLPIRLLRKLPFHSDVAVEGLLPGGEATVKASCPALQLTIGDGKLLCEAELVLSAVTQHRQRLTYTADLCCIGQHTEVEHLPTAYCSPLRCINTNFTQSHTLTAKDSPLPASAQLLDVHATVLPDSLTLHTDAGRCTIEGSCRYSIIYSADDELAAREIELPFRLISDAAPAAAPSRPAFELSAEVISVKGRSDEREGRLQLETELAISLRLWEECSFSPVSQVKASAPYSIPAGSRTIYYPLPGETLWSVAKRYCSAVEHIAQKNHLPSVRADHPDSLDGVHLLVI